MGHEKHGPEKHDHEKRKNEHHSSRQPGWSKQPAANLKQPETGTGFVRVEVKSGAKSGPRIDAAESFVVVLSGAYRLELPEGPVALEALEMARIPAGVKHSGEALRDAVLLLSKASPKKPSASERLNSDQDSDQYLWGV